MKLKSINPYNNKVIETFESYSEKEINKRISRSETAFEAWKQTSFDERKALMLKLADLLIENTTALGEIVTEEMGKPLTEAKAEIEKCSWVCEYYANESEIFLHREAVATESHGSYIEYEPLGTILGVMPWNFPFWQVFRFIAPTLMAGNVVLLKHASNVQRSARAIQELLDKAGFPEGVFQNLVIGAKQVKKIIGHPAIKAVTLTGSEPAGKSVATEAANNIKKSVLELGGNNAFIVLDDADVDKAVEIGLKARMQNGGQSCIAAKRFILHEKISEKFIEKFTHSLNKLVVGDPLKEQTDIGPLSSIEQAEKVTEQVNRSVEMGAKIIAGAPAEGAFFYPTLVVNVKPGMPLFDEEVFGPVAPITIVNSVEEAIELSNKSVYGLGVSLFTNDLKKAQALVPEFDDGAVFINALVKSHPRLPFGGTKHSGYGRELSVAGIREFVNIKTVYIDKLNDTNNNKNKRVAISVGSPG
ncbi:NAD-dependent succinate-semialdehyde dehydrogenase [Maribellus mangrovi]|uniref:NAD-dependent succinate-semialdehyde dehydrogenase n=1 Tax=Maribellus mangrovi TaxID=3133146 RepID=UPI0030EB7202